MRVWPSDLRPRYVHVCMCMHACMCACVHACFVHVWAARLLCHQIADAKAYVWWECEYVIANVPVRRCCRWSQFLFRSPRCSSLLAHRNAHGDRTPPCAFRSACARSQRGEAGAPTNHIGAEGSAPEQRHNKNLRGEQGSAHELLWLVGATIPLHPIVSVHPHALAFMICASYCIAVAINIIKPVNG